jgi:hypothetical protein
MDPATTAPQSCSRCAATPQAHRRTVRRDVTARREPPLLPDWQQTCLIASDGWTDSIAAVLNATLEDTTRRRIEALIDEGRDIFYSFDDDVRSRHFHPFIPADYDRVLELLIELRQPGLRFLEWGSATGVITIMADMLGFDACGIELDSELVRTARSLADRYESTARFALGSFLPTGYVYETEDGDRRLGTIGHGRSGYLELQRPLEDFDVVFGYPWSGEAAMMQDLMRAYGSPHARLILWGTEDS